jgi:cytochrome d ubiquinol oxidase subunit I
VKIAAVEAHWDGSTPAELVLFAWPDEKAETNRYAIAIPKLGSIILTHDSNGLFAGLKSVAVSERPPVVPPFFAFRIMVGIGLLMIAAGFVGVFLWWRGRLFETRWYLALVAQGWWLGFVAVISGWIVTEVGRQPWLATGILRTADAISPVPAMSVAVSLGLFVVVYAIVFAMGIYYINRLIARGPEGRAAEPPSRGLPNRPFTAAEDAARETFGTKATSP